MSMNFTAVTNEAERVLDAFNILGAGLILVWIIGSIFLARAISERKDEWVLTMVVFLMCGGLLFFASDPAKFVILIVVVLIVIFGMFKILYTRNREN